ncbi:DNA polymerase III subunit gamma/tau C-terminal domain-containing protein, partial [Stenotrophomonas pictorum]
PSAPEVPAGKPVSTDDLPPWAIEAADARARDEAMAMEMAQAEPEPVRQAPVAAPAVVPPVADAVERGPDVPVRALENAEQWLDLVADSGLSGPSRELAANCAFVSFQHGVLRLGLLPGFEYLQTERALTALAQALAQALGTTPKIVIETGNVQAETLHERADRQRGERQNAAEAVFMADPQVRQLLQQGARVVADSIRPIEE